MLKMRYSLETALTCNHKINNAGVSKINYKIVGSVFETVKAPFSRRPSDHDREI